MRILKGEKRIKIKIKNSTLYVKKKENEKMIGNRVKIIKQQDQEGGKTGKTNGNNDEEIWMSTMRPHRSLKVVNKTNIRVFRFHCGFPMIITSLIIPTSPLENKTIQKYFSI